jgi:hypothetical protein
MQNLIMTLHGLYQDQYGTQFETKVSSIKTDSNSKNLKQETAELLIKLLQAESTEKPDTVIQEKDKTTKHAGPKLVPQLEPAPSLNQDLIDSIRYASMLDK